MTYRVFQTTPPAKKKRAPDRGRGLVRGASDRALLPPLSNQDLLDQAGDVRGLE